MTIKGKLRQIRYLPRAPLQARRDLKRLQSKNCVDAIFSAHCTGMCVARLKHKRIQIEEFPS